MGVSGGFAKTFKEANLVCAVDVHMNDDCPKFFDILEVNGTAMKLKSHWNGNISEHKIKRKNGTEYITIEHIGLFERAFKNGKPRRIKLLPFTGKRF